MKRWKTNPLQHLFTASSQIAVALLLFLTSLGHGQQTRWIRVGMLHNWYMETGCEWEVGRRGLIRDQQDGLQWPAQFANQDNQAAKGLWIGARDYFDAVANTTYQYKVVQIGPRKSDYTNEIFPLEFKMIGRYNHPTVLVNGEVASDMDYDDIVDEAPVENLSADRVLITKIRTSMGIEMTRRVYAFSQQFHDDYHIVEYVFKNTGIIDDKGTQNPQTIKDMYVMWQFRYAICKEVGWYGSGVDYMPQSVTWGDNTVYDVFWEDPRTGNPMRGFFAWHGKHSKAVYNGQNFDNIGGPNVAKDGRLSASQFVGVVVLHADKSATDHSDDPNQPSNTWYIDSDAIYNQAGYHSQFNAEKMRTQYELMSAGHPPVDHAELVGDGFADQLGSDGGFSQALGFGPYTLEVGDSIRIVLAEGAGGLSWEKNLEVGRTWFSPDSTHFILPDGTPTNDRDAYKDAWVFTGKDSILQTFERAIQNWRDNMNIPQAPPPPDYFEVNSGGDRIQLKWSQSAESWPNLDGYTIYRAISRPDTVYEKLVDLPRGVFEYNDTSASRGFDYYYYIASRDDGTNLTGVPLYSSMFYTRTNMPANLLRQAGESLEAIRVVPNPYNIRAARDPRLQLGFGYERIAFLNIPGYCKIKIYTERGDLIKEIIHDDGSGDEYWNLETDSGQLIVSGIYIVYFEVTEDQRDPNTGKVLYRKGDRAFRKFIVIR